MRLVEESHFMLDVLRCPECAQRFVLVYMERIDWTGGEDATTHNLMPLTAPEAALMLAAGEDVDVAEIQRIGRARRYLCDEWPTGRERIVEYEVGWVVPPHD